MRIRRVVLTMVALGMGSLLHGCVRCAEGDVVQDGQCVRPCNGNAECGVDSQCVDGFCRAGASGTAAVASASASSSVGASSAAAASSSSAQVSSSVGASASATAASSSSSSSVASSSSSAAASSFSATSSGGAVTSSTSSGNSSSVASSSSSSADTSSSAAVTSSSSAAASSSSTASSVAGVSSSSASSSSAAASSSGGAPVTACGKVTRLVDVFDGDPLESMWDGTYAYGGATLGVTAGHLVVTVPGSVDDAGAALGTSRSYDLTDSALSVAVSEVFNASTTAQVLLRAWAPDGVIGLLAEGGYLYAEHAQIDPWSKTVVASVPYDAQQHRFWRIAESDGTMSWQVSADRSAWTELANSPVPYDLRHVRVEVGGLTYQAIDALVEGRFADVNAGATPMPWCAASSLVDTFDAPGFDWRRSFANAGCTAQVASGHLTLTGTATFQHCAQISSTSFTLQDDAVTIMLTDASLPDMSYAYFAVRGPDGNVAQLTLYDGGILAQHATAWNYENLQDVFYGGGVRWLRIASQGDTISWAVSEDAMTWTSLGARQRWFPLDEVDLILGLATENAASSWVGWDNLNVVP